MWQAGWHILQKCKEQTHMFIFKWHWKSIFTLNTFKCTGTADRVTRYICVDVMCRPNACVLMAHQTCLFPRFRSLALPQRITKPWLKMLACTWSLPITPGKQLKSQLKSILAVITSHKSTRTRECIQDHMKKHMHTFYIGSGFTVTAREASGLWKIIIINV